MVQEEIVTADGKSKFLRDAERYVLNGKVQQAIGEYLKVIDCDPDDVLIINTVGDLYLKQGNLLEANRCFAQVAENYVQNNFFLKAIAVYRKILNADPENLEINSAIASLYAKQGLNIDARNQYVLVAELLEREGKKDESLSAYEKVVELDPANVAVQQKLAELHLAAGANEKARFHFMSAAEAQTKTGNLTAAVNIFERARELNPSDVDTMRAFLECCLEMGDVTPVLGHIHKSLETAPDSLDLREMLGRAYVANNELETAAKTIKFVVSMDESRYNSIFAVAQALIDVNEYDQAADCIDSIVPILITRRETRRAVKLYEQILGKNPSHILTLTQLASIHSATDDKVRLLDVLDKIAEYHLSRQNPREALEYLDKILRLNSESEKHQQLHRQAFAEVYPDSPYVAPEAPLETQTESIVSEVPARDAVVSGDGVSNQLVEVDLLLNYGMKEKALSLLKSLETRYPYNKEVRSRLLALFKEEKKNIEAAEQCLLLAALYRKSNDEESAQGYLTEAKQLDPDMPADDSDLEALAQMRGISLESSSGATRDKMKPGPEAEVDLSEDLVDIFFTKDQVDITPDDSEPLQTTMGVMTEEYPQDVPSPAPTRSLQEQFQEADFYIRLGFREEAHAKLDEIAKISPEDPELLARYRQLDTLDSSEEGEQKISAKPVGDNVEETPGEAQPHEQVVFRDLKIDETLDAFDQRDAGENAAEQLTKSALLTDVDLESDTIGIEIPEQPQLQDLPPPEPKESEARVNEMFADLMEEFSSQSDQQTAQEAFDEHFHLGTAYREMDLMEEAIREFQNALKALDQTSTKDTNRVVQCCGMLSTCFLKKGMPSSAVRYCQTGLSVADISSHEAMALRYDMGVAHSMAGSSKMALKCFDQIFAMDPGYRDVAQRIDELRACG